MSVLTLREKIQALIDNQYAIDPDDLQAVLDTHTDIKPAPAVPDDVAGRLDDICHDEQMVVWASELMGDLCEWLDFDDYDDKLDAVASVKRTIRSIVKVALEAHTAELARVNDKLKLEYAITDAANIKAAAAEAENARLREALTDLVSWFSGGPSSYGPWIIVAGKDGADEAVEFARAALTHPTGGQE